MFSLLWVFGALRYNSQCNSWRSPFPFIFLFTCNISHISALSDNPEQKLNSISPYLSQETYAVPESSSKFSFQLPQVPLFACRAFPLWQSSRKPTDQNQSPALILFRNINMLFSYLHRARPLQTPLRSGYLLQPLQFRVLTSVHHECATHQQWEKTENYWCKALEDCRNKEKFDDNPRSYNNWKIFFSITFYVLLSKLITADICISQTICFVFLHLFTVQASRCQEDFKHTTWLEVRLKP